MNSRSPKSEQTPPSNTPPTSPSSSSAASSGAAPSSSTSPSSSAAASASAQSPSPTAGPPAEAREAAGILRIGGWVSFWLQGAIAVISGVVLVFSFFSRSIESETNNPSVGFVMFLGAMGIAIALVCTFWEFRLTRFARRLRRPKAMRHPQKSETLRLIRWILYASLGGLAISLLGSELGVGALLAKSFAQPQGAAIYTPDKIIRVLDILVALVCTSVAGAHFISLIASLWLLKRIK